MEFGIAVLIILGIVVYTYIPTFLIEIQHPFPSIHIPSWAVTALEFILIGSAVILAPILFYKISIRIHERAKEKERKRVEEKNEFESISRAIKRELGDSSHEIKKYLGELEDALKHCRKNKKFKVFLEDINNKLKLSEEKLVEVEYEERIDSLNNEVYKKETKIRELEEKEQEKKRALISERWEILANLNIDEKNVLKKCNLSDKEKRALIQEGFEQVNEFCVFEMKRVPVLVKPESNHSATHTFLVWSTKRLLEHTHGIKYIEEHLSKEPDLTFEYQNKTYALEIETGSLLGKSEQKREKVNSLNRDYEDGWMFIVSNRDLLGKYSKLGFTSQRKDVQKNLKKLLKIA